MIVYESKKYNNLSIILLMKSLLLTNTFTLSERIEYQYKCLLQTRSPYMNTRNNKK